MRRVAVFGSTGSIGTQTLDVLSRLGEEFAVVGLAAGHWSSAFADQIVRWQPRMAAVADGATGEVDALTCVIEGPDALERLVAELEPDVVVMGTPTRPGVPMTTTSGSSSATSLSGAS